MRNEWEIERLFRESGPFFHVHTEPLETGVIFMTDEERQVAMVYVAIAAMLAGVEVVAFALMSNHFHFILRGQEGRCRAFYARFAKMLDLYLSRHGRPGVLDSIGQPAPTPITTLKQLRDEIAYVIRNPFVVRKDINPFAYPWCSGFLYFNPMLSMLKQQPASALTLREKRALTHSRSLPLPTDLTWSMAASSPAALSITAWSSRCSPTAVNSCSGYSRTSKPKSKPPFAWATSPPYRTTTSSPSRSSSAKKNSA